MVNTDVVIEEAINGILVGVGAFGAGWLGDQIDNHTNFTTLQRSAAKVGAGAALSIVAADDSILELDGEVRRGAKHVGYGVQGAGWSEIGGNFVVSGRGGSSSSRGKRRTRRVRRASTDGGRSRNSSSSSSSDSVSREDDDLLVDA